MTANIPVSIRAIQNDLPKIKAQVTALNAEEKRAIREHLSQLSFQRRLEGEINRELKEQIAQRRRLTTLTSKLDKGMAGGGAGFGALGGLGGALGALGLGVGISEVVQFGKEAEEMGRQLEGVQTRLRNTLGSADEYARAIATAREQTRGMTSETDLASGMFTFLNARLAENVEEAANLSRAQGILVSAFGTLGANEEKFIRLLAAGNQALFDNFNLTSASINARKAQIESTRGLSSEEAKLAAIKELVIEKADELEGSLTANEIAARQFDAASKDLKATIGQELTPAFTGAKEGLADLFRQTEDAIKGWGLAFDTLTNLTNAQRVLNAQQQQEAEQLGENTTWWQQYLNAVDSSSGGLVSFIEGVYNAATGNEDLAETFNQVTQAADKVSPIVQQSTDDIEDNTEALEEEAKRLEKVADIRERSVRKLLEVDEQFQEDTAETWKDWREDQEELFEDYSDKRGDILEKAAKDAAKIEKDLAKDLAKLNKDTTKDLQKINDDEKKKIKELKQNAAKEERQESKKRRVDTLADERLFQFDLRQLAAEGSANAIKEALERRAIEEQIEREKQEVENSIKDENLEDDIERVRDEADERRSEREVEAAERREELQAEVEEERQLKEEALREALEDEKENFIERSQQLWDYRGEKLAQLEEDRKDTIAKIGEELTEIKDITKQELKKLVPIFAQFGEDAGNAFSDGLSEGFNINAALAEMLDQPVGGLAEESLPGYKASSPGGKFGLGKNPGMLTFAEGGTVPGPLGQPQLVIAHGGETFTPPGKSSGSITFIFNNTTFGNAVTDNEVIGILQKYTDEILGPALG